MERSGPWANGARALAFFVLCSCSGVALADCASQTDIPEEQCDTLVTLYLDAGGANWTDNSNWLDEHPCTWSGVSCKSNEVSKLYLTNNNLIGTFGDLSALKSLDWLNLDFNALTGSVGGISGLPLLRGADLTGNSFTSGLDQLNNLPSLFYLNLSYNAFSGTLPASLAGLPAHTSIGLDNNSLSGQIPDVFVNSGIGALAIAGQDLCVSGNVANDWWLSLDDSHTALPTCWTIRADLNDSLLYAHDALNLYARVDGKSLTTPIPMDFYLSILLPDGNTELFLVKKGGAVSFHPGSADSSSWAAYLSGYTLNPSADSGLLPVFSYLFKGGEPVGRYLFRIRAVEPGTTNVLQSVEVPFYFSHSSTRMAIQAPDEARTGEAVAFSMNTDEADSSYHWEFSDGGAADGRSVTHTFTGPNRYGTALTVTRKGVEIPHTFHHNINISRPYADTAYATGFQSPGTLDFDYAWNDCNNTWDVYEGKYHELRIEHGLQYDTGKLRNLLSFLDNLFQVYSSVLQWQSLVDSNAMQVNICGEIAGGGSGGGGTFLNADVMDLLPSGDFNAIPMAGFIHEFIHLWDFRMSHWLNGYDPAHSFTGAMELVFGDLIGSGHNLTGWAGDLNAQGPLSPAYLLNHYMRIDAYRYLHDPALDWSHYYEPPFIDKAFDDLELPENKETILIPSYILLSIYRMHGLEGLEKVFAAMEGQRLRHPEWGDELSQQDRLENLERAVSDALQIDARDYFNYWKFPYYGMGVYMAQYPKSAEIVDADGDGVSPLQGDWNDGDPNVYPDAPEHQDGKDDNLDGLVDENVYDEGSGDYTNEPITLPALVKASLSDLDDTDSYTFTLDAPATVSIVIAATRSGPTSDYATDSNRSTSVINGSVYLNGGLMTGFVDYHMSATEAIVPQALSAGTYTLKWSTHTSDTRISNPGPYEMQVFVDQYEHDYNADDLVKRLYP